jgi:hypothetical protein
MEDQQGRYAAAWNTTTEMQTREDTAVGMIKPDYGMKVERMNGHGKTLIPIMGRWVVRSKMEVVRGNTGDQDS